MGYADAASHSSDTAPCAWDIYRGYCEGDHPIRYTNRNHIGLDRMETILSIKPLLAVLVSVTAVPFIVSSKRPNIREAWTFIAAIAKFLIVVSMIPVILSGKEIIFTLADVFKGVSIGFRVDSIGLLFAIVSSFLWIITSVYSIGYMRGLNEHSQTRYFSFFALSLSATMGVAFSSNLFTLYLFYEMLSFSTYPLVTHHQDMEARH